MSKNIERPIILNMQEVNAVLAGDKTQHRVIIENTKETQCLFSRDWRYDGRDFLDDDCTPDPKGAHYVERLEPDQGEENQYTEDYRCIGHCPLGAIGDRLWVQEPSLIHCDWDWFYADNTLVKCKDPFSGNDLDLPWDDENQEYKGPIGAEYLPRWASRLLLEITDIRIERVRDISETDALASGLQVQSCDQGSQWFFNPMSNMPSNVFHRDEWIGGFESYWDSLNGKLSFNENTWVWVIEFKVI